MNIHSRLFGLTNAPNFANGAIPENSLQSVQTAVHGASDITVIRYAQLR